MRRPQQLSMGLAALVLAMGCLEKTRRTLGLVRDPHPDVLYSVEIDERVLALTIDDGPDPTSTPAILDVLDRHQATATFFLIADRVPGNEALVERIVAAGHELGSHGTRDEPSIELPPEVFERELLRAHGTLSAFATPRWFRPGSGWYDQRMVEILARHGYRCALGSSYGLDAQLPFSWLARRLILWRAEPGAVVILHDVGERGARTAVTLSEVLPELRRRGYRVVSLSELETRAGSHAPEDIR